ncbi:MAG: twin-arginine translocation signal domain-containing protein [Gemmatimonadetes bacterium]|nr:twin-arginine translocation signal domain-containing protein [Gemmatimonadota bacterium]
MRDDGVTRRDFLNGVSVALGASLLAPWADLIAQGWDPGSDYYPPARTGLRGTHEGAWETMHARVQGKTWRAGAPRSSTTS